MYLVQLLLPLSDNDGNPFKAEAFNQVRTELTDAFGGVTTFRRSPAEGLWQEREGRVIPDEMVIFEVMTEQLEGE